MTSNTPQDWSLDGLLDEIAMIDRTMPDRSLAFILGAGASAASGIETGAQLAERWLRQIHQRERLDESTLEVWLANGGAGIRGLTIPQLAAEFYPQIYERRFRGDPDSGYAALEQVMAEAVPSIGYSMLAEILDKTRHKVVVTTNFDNLVADALAIHGNKAPLIVAHETLTGFVRSQLRRPLVAKIHNDLLLHPKNEKQQIASLEAGWRSALHSLFEAYMPIVIGYGGNDGSLMGLLRSLDPREMAGHIVWCHPHDAPPSRAVDRLLASHGGVRVGIPDFDEFMARLAARVVAGFDLAGISRRTERLGRKRTDLFRFNAEELVRKVSSRKDPSQRPWITGLALDDSHWWTWALRAAANPDVGEREKILRQGLEKLPTSADLHARRALFLALGPKPQTAKEEYEQALAHNPTHVGIVREFAQYLHWVGEYDEAEKRYQQAWTLDPADADNNRNYANFLHYVRDRQDQAERLFARARELAPTELRPTLDYARFLCSVRGKDDVAERMFKDAVELAPGDRETVTLYAQFLTWNRQNRDAAEVLYRKALQGYQVKARLKRDYADFRVQCGGDLHEAEALYLEAIQADPFDPQLMASYAAFLEDKRKDYAGAERRYKEADATGYADAWCLVRYARFLWRVRRLPGNAEEIYKKALTNHHYDSYPILAYAEFLQFNERPDEADEKYEQALKLQPNDTGAMANRACLLLCRGDETSTAEAIRWAQRSVEHCRRRPVASQEYAEALLYLCLAAELPGGTRPGAQLNALKGFLEREYVRVPWDFEPVFKAVFPRIEEPRRRLYKALGNAILDRDAVGQLDELDDWKTIEPVDSFAAPAAAPEAPAGNAAPHPV